MPLALPKSRAEITAVQEDRKVAAVRNALRGPFHKQRLKGVDPEQMTDPAKWREIPLLTKEDLRQLSPQQYFSDFCLAKPHRGRRILALRRRYRRALFLSAHLY